MRRGLKTIIRREGWHVGPDAVHAFWRGMRFRQRRGPEPVPPRLGGWNGGSPYAKRLSALLGAVGDREAERAGLWNQDNRISWELGWAYAHRKLTRTGGTP